MVSTDQHPHSHSRRAKTTNTSDFVAVLKGIVGCTGVALWLLLFAAGLLINSERYRDEISPPQTVAAMVPTSSSEHAGLPMDLHPRDSINWSAFGITVLTYTPLNAALLVLLAGFVGGCASNITYTGASDLLHDPTKHDADPRLAHRAAFLIENPLASMLRSFLVYVGFMAGIDITSNAPFVKPTVDQYVRLAGTLSMVAFVVGYDPTKFQSFLNLVPRLGGEQK
jgi:hypothetical protein